MPVPYYLLPVPYYLLPNTLSEPLMQAMLIVKVAVGRAGRDRYLTPYRVPTGVRANHTPDLLSGEESSRCGQKPRRAISP